MNEFEYQKYTSVKLEFDFLSVTLCALKHSDISEKPPPIQLLSKVFLNNQAYLFDMSNYMGSIIK